MTSSNAVCIRLSVTQKGGKFGRPLKSKPEGKPCRVVQDDNAFADAASAAAAGDTGTIRVVAVADWPGTSGAMAFTRGDHGELVYVSDLGWLCVHMGEQTGWVPADYWRIITYVRLLPPSIQCSLLLNGICKTFKALGDYLIGHFFLCSL